jgi:catechol 2,3-dioxygenase-like lactoylglutathione lyase family enzyme
MITTIDHPAIACNDVQRQTKWYCDNLGMRVMARNDTSALVGYGENTQSGAMIELMPAKDPGPPPVEVPRYSPGLRHLAFRVSNFDEALKRLKSAHVTLIGEIGLALGGRRIQSFRDPEGNELQILER